MAQESADSIIEYAKCYEQAQKALGVQRWVYISIERTNEAGVKERVHTFDLPLEVYRRREWVVRWREAKMVCMYPRSNVRTYTSYYDKRLGNDKRLTEDLRKLTSAKAQVTKAQRELQRHIEWNRQNNMFFDEATDPAVVKFRTKLAAKEKAVTEAEERMRNKINELRNESEGVLRCSRADAQGAEGI